MEVLVTGGAGMLGTDLTSELARRDHVVKSPSRSEFDISNPEDAAKVAAGEMGSPAWCVNCAAYTAVDRAEDEPDLAMLVNGVAPGYLANSCGIAGVRLLHVSTDFVFDGERRVPYTETDATNPLGAYARSKREGENAVLSAGGNPVIVRTAWLYGPNGQSFPRAIIRAWLSGKQLRVVADQIGNPTYTAELARVMCDIIEADSEGGIYHAGGPETMTWHTFAGLAVEAYRSEVLHDSKPSPEITPIATADWPTPARRPKYSALSFEKVRSLGVQPMASPKVSLKDFVRRLSV